MNQSNEKEKSPDIVVKPKPRSGMRIGKKAGILASALIIGAVFVTGYNILFKDDGTTQDNKTVKANDKKLTAAQSNSQEMMAASKNLPRQTQETTSTTPDLSNLNAQKTTSTANLAEAKLNEEQQAQLKLAMASDPAVDRFKANAAANSNQTPTTTTATMIGVGSSTQEQSKSDGEDQNRQSEKLAFLEKSAKKPATNYLQSVRTAPLSPLEIKAGTIIPAIMIDGINSDLPGDITAQVSENVYDTETGQHLLIPQGSKLFGSYDSKVAYGQNGLLVSWKRLIYPDASSLDLEGMGGSDKSGYSGFRDKVNNHYVRLIGFGLMTSLFSAAFQLSQPQQQQVLAPPNAQQVAAAAVGQQMTQLGIEVTRKNLNIQPTIEIRPGYRFVVKVNKDVVFPKIYTH
jgi:type IV secretory pathway VirB10-like protein